MTLNINRGPPWWSGGWGSTSQCRVYGFNPWLRTGIPHIVGQLSLSQTTTTKKKMMQLAPTEAKINKYFSKRTKKKVIPEALVENHVFRTGL